MLGGLFFEFSSESGNVTFTLFVKLDLQQKKNAKENTRLSIRALSRVTQFKITKKQSSF